jgi:CRP-like cAMP-binding protein
MAEDKALRKARAKLAKALEADATEEAIALLVEIARAEPKNARWPHQQGDLCRRLNQIPEAVEAYALAAVLYAEQGLTSRAVALAKTVLKLDPSRTDVLARLGPDAAQQLRSERQGRSLTGQHSRPPDAATGRRPSVALEEGFAGTAARERAGPTAGVSGSGQDPASRRVAGAVPPPPPAAAFRRGAGVDPPLTAATRFELSDPPQRGREPPTPARTAGASQALPLSAAKAPGLTLDRLSLPPTLLQRSAAAARLPASSGGVLGRPEFAGALAQQTRFDVIGSGLSDEVEPVDRELERLPSAPLTAATPARLPDFSLFAELPRVVLADMIAGSSLIELAHGAWVMRRGDPSDALYGVVEGCVQVLVPGQEARSSLSPGEVFGESALLQDERRHADAIAHGRSIVLRIPRGVLALALERHPSLAELLFELLTRRLVSNLMQVSPLFGEFNAAARGEIAQLFEIRRAPAYTVLAIAGKRMDGLYLALTGSLLIRQQGKPERIAPAGTMFGQNTLLTHAPSALDVQARVDMILLRLPGTQFMSVAMQYPTILERLAELSTSEVVEVTI